MPFMVKTPMSFALPPACRQPEKGSFLTATLASRATVSPKIGLNSGIIIAQS
jgi:hypothetical protein